MVFVLADTKRTSYMDYTFPLVCDLIGWAIALIIIICIPAVAVVKVVQNYRTSQLAKVRRGAGSNILFVSDSVVIMDYGLTTLLTHYGRHHPCRHRTI